MTSQNYKHFHGHRQRLKEKFLDSYTTRGSAEHFPDYEILEIILFAALPRKDVKPLAKLLLQTFNNFGELINASQNKILEVSGATTSVYLHLKIIKEIMHRTMYNKVVNRNVISSWSCLVEYLQNTIGYENIEQFRILFLNKRNILIADELQAKGTIDQTPLYPREVVKRALFYEASAIILVHNHPSGNPKPSKADIELTQRVQSACNSIGIVVHDHIIICKNDFYSFKSNSMI